MSEPAESPSPITTTDLPDSSLGERTPASGERKRKLGDWIDSFLDYTSSAASPEIFRLWSGITCLAGALERRVWTHTKQSILYPHLYTLLVAPPAVGKGQAISPTEFMWHRARGKITGRLKVAPRSMSRASLIDELADAARRIPMNKFLGHENSVDLLEYAYLLVTAEELGVLLSAHDLDFLSVLTALYNGLPNYTERKRTGNIKHEVVNPLITFLAGSQPAFLASVLPEEAWSMGAMSRIIMVYSGTPVETDLFEDPLASGNAKTKALESCLLSDLGQVLDTYGCFTWEPDASSAIIAWRAGGFQPAPEHSKLVHYNGRRILHIIKLCMIASISRGGDLKISLTDFERAKGWLLMAESTMPDIFREMVGRSDAQLIGDLYFFVFSQWMRNSKEPLHESQLYYFLQTKTSSERIPRIIDTAERAGIIARVAGTTAANGGARYVPRPKNEHGVE